MKAYLTVNEIAERSGVAPHVIRYYTRVGLLRPGRNTRNGYRLSADADVARLRFIRQAKSLGFSLREIATIFRESQKGRSPCPLVRQIIKARVRQNREALDEMVKLQARMERALAKWSRMPDGMPDGRSICHLIESSGEQ